MKFHDFDVVDAVIASGVNVTGQTSPAVAGTLNAIAQGVTEATRVGRKCTIRSINVRFQLRLPAIDGTGTAPLGDTVRVILYLDKQANGATAASTDILEAASFQSFNNLANSGRFRTLMDRTYNMNYPGGSGAGGAADNDWPSIRVDDTFFKKCSIPLEFSSTTGALTEIRSNNLGLLLCSDSGTAGYESKWRLRFSDS